MPPPPPPPAGYSDHSGAPVEKKNGLGIASLVLGIISILALITVVGAILFGLIGVILGFIARGRVKRGEADNGGVALAGLIMSFLGLVAGIAIIVAGVLFFADDFNNLTDCLDDAGDSQTAVDQCSQDFEDDVVGG